MESKRLASLDAFRGFTVAAMILVNNPGSWEHIYEPLEHAKWNGLTPTDLVFPFFLFIMGTSVTLAFSKKRKQESASGSLYLKIFSRTLKIFLLGIFLNLLPDFNISELRVAGVLQRIAIVYMVCAILFLQTRWKIQLMLGGIILFLYWICMCYIPTPGYEVAMLAPGNNLAAWVDSQLLPGKMWQGTWDPEGLLSTLPAIVTGIAGMLAGKLLIAEIQVEKKVIGLFISGLLACTLGYMWSWIFPFNKNLWTSSFVLFTGGLASMILASGIFLLDVKRVIKPFRFGIIYGENAITVYVVAGLLAILLYQPVLAGHSVNDLFMDTLNCSGIGYKFASMCFALFCVGLNFIPACILHRKKILIRL
jgi:predicted acyltransferase